MLFFFAAPFFPRPLMITVLLVFLVLEDLGVLALFFLEPAGGVVGGLVVATMMMTAKNEFFVPACCTS